jgi:hypothetical protein
MILEWAIISNRIQPETHFDAICDGLMVFLDRVLLSGTCTKEVRAPSHPVPLSSISFFAAPPQTLSHRAATSNLRGQANTGRLGVHNMGSQTSSMSSPTQVSAGAWPKREGCGVIPAIEEPTEALVLRADATWDARPSINEKSELMYGGGDSDHVEHTVVEKREEQSSRPEPPACDTATNHYCACYHRRTLLGLPKEVRNLIYSYVLAVEEFSFPWSGVSHGLICLADEPGYPSKLTNLEYMQSDDQRFTEDYFTEDQDLLKPFISRKLNVSRIEINQLKYVSRADVSKNLI